MARLSLVAEGPHTGTPLTGAQYLEATGLLHNPGDGCDHCDNWQQRHYRAGTWTDCEDPRCICVLAPTYPEGGR